MRVISGKARGSKLIAPSGLETRPTGDRMKEDLFNILGASVADAYFLDLYCGSGAVGIEALSRGARAAVFVDSSPKAVKAAEANLVKTRLRGSAEIFMLPAESAARDKLAGRTFDIIFADPPYAAGDLAGILEFVVQFRLLSENGIFIAECPLAVVLLEENGLALYRRKQYAQMQFLFYERSW